MKWTLNQAARETGIAKATIKRRIENHELSAEREGEGYQIDPAELTRVFDLVAGPDGKLTRRNPVNVARATPQATGRDTGEASGGVELGILPLERVELVQLRERSQAQAAMIERLTLENTRLAGTIEHERRLLAAPRGEATPANDDASPRVQEAARAVEAMPQEKPRRRLFGFLGGVKS